MRGARQKPSVYDAVRSRLREGAAHQAPLLTLERSRRRKGVDVWEILDRNTDITALRPKLADDIEIAEFPEDRGGGHIMIANPRALVHIRLPYEDLALLRLMDGTRTVVDLVVERFRGSGDMELNLVAGLVLDLFEGGFLEQQYVDVHGAVAREIVSPGARRRKRLLKTLTIEWHGADRFVRRLYEGGLHRLLKPGPVIVFALVSAAGLAAFIRMQFGRRFDFSGEEVALAGLIVLGLNFALVLVHELGHAVMLVKYGRRLKFAAIQIYFGAPTALIESSDVLMLDKKRRVTQAVAGVLAESVFAGVASLVAWAYPDLAISSVLFKFAVLNYFYIFLNLVPLLELDGYWIMSDLLEIPDLRPRALSFLRRDLLRKIVKREPLTRNEIGLAIYANFGVAFTVAALWWSAHFWYELFAGLTRQLWHGGFGTRILLFVLAVIVLGPLIRGVMKLLAATGRRIYSLAASIRFVLQRGWRVEAARLIDALPAFDDLPEDLLSDIAGKVKLRRLHRGETVVRQGDRADTFYVVRRGVLHVIEEGPDGSERTLTSLVRGDAFGEAALLDAGPRRATVRAVAHAEVFAIDKGTFDRLLADAMRAPEFGPTMGDLNELRRIRSFSHLSTTQLSRLLARGEWISAVPREIIVKQGERGDGFYAILSGQVEVLKSRRVIATLGAGDHFGELALLSDEYRKATVRALTPARIFRVDRAGFNMLVKRAFRDGRLIAQGTNRTARTGGG